ncbi:MAG TPA: hypothetical protein PLB18_03900 [Acidobacteriota bacterium]|nr:hypothetical protein [Acidobacteriota bacterium]
MKKSLFCLVSLFLVQLVVGGNLVLAATPSGSTTQFLVPQQAANASTTGGSSGTATDAAASQDQEYNDMLAATDEKDAELRYKKIQEFIGKYPQTQYKAFVYARLNGARGVLINKSLGKGNMADAHKYGRELFAEPKENKEGLDDFPYYWLLGRASGLIAIQSNDNGYLKVGAEYSQKALDLIAQGSKIDNKSIKWEEKKNSIAADLHRTIAMMHYIDAKYDDATREFEEAIKVDCDAYGLYYRGRIKFIDFTAAAKAYNDIPDKTTPDTATALATAKDKARVASEYLAKAIAFIEKRSDAATFKSFSDDARKLLDPVFNFAYEDKINEQPAPPPAPEPDPKAKPGAKPATATATTPPAEDPKVKAARLMAEEIDKYKAQPCQ